MQLERLILQTTLGGDDSNINSGISDPGLCEPAWTNSWLQSQPRRTATIIEHDELLHLDYKLYHSSRYQFFGKSGVTAESKTLLAGLLLMRKGRLPFRVVSFEFRALLSIKSSTSKSLNISGESQKCSQCWSSLSTDSESERGQFIPPFPRLSSMSKICSFSRWSEICPSATLFLFSRS